MAKTASLIPNEQIIKRRVSISTRPMKLAFIINKNISKKELVKYFEYNTAIWGGYYSLLIPTDGQTVREDWWRTLLYHDPDLIIAHGEIDSTLIKKLQSQIQPYYVWQWTREQLLRETPPGTDYFDNILMRDILQYEDEVKYIPPVQFKLRVPQIPKDCCYYEYASAQFGIFPERTRKIYMERLQGLLVEFKSDDFYSYLQCIEELETQSTPNERILTPIMTTRSGLSPICGGIGNSNGKAFKTFIILTGEHEITDFCLFWNLRMQSNLGHSKEILIVPFSVFEEQHNIQVLAEWCNQLWNWHNHLVLASASLEEKQVLSFRERLMPYLKESIETVDIWCQHFVTKGIQIQHKIRDTEEFTFRDGIFHLHLPPSTFVESTLQGRWITDIHIENDGLECNGFLPPKYDGLNKLLSNDPYQGIHPSNPGFSTRLANNLVTMKTLAYRVPCCQTQLIGRLPSTEEIFVSLLNNRGYNVKKTEKCKYYQGILDLIGGLQELTVFFKFPHLRELFHKMKNGAAYTPREMVPILKFGCEKTKHFSMIKNFLKKKIFLRGYEIQCPICDLTRWYALKDVDEMMRCVGCLTLFQPPIDAPFCYKLNELVARGVEQGGMPVLFTLLFLQRLIPLSPFSSFMFVPGVEISRKDNKPICFKLEKLKDWKDKEISDSIIQSLKEIENQEYLTQEEFINALRTILGEEQIQEWKDRILECGSKRKVDIDIIGSCNGHVFVVECKNLESSSELKKPKQIFSQLKTLVNIAKTIEAEMVFLSVLSDDVLKNFQERIEDIDHHAGESLSVHLLTGTDLKRGYKTMLSENSQTNESSKEEPLFLNAFLPLNTLKL